MPHKNFLLIFLVHTIFIGHLWAYNRSDAVVYAEKWWNTDLRGAIKGAIPDELVDGINNPKSKAVEDGLRTSNKSYLFHYYEGKRSNGKTNKGDNTVHFKNGGVNCANFVSQCLIDGGIKFPTGDPRVSAAEGTIPSASDLGNALNGMQITNKTIPTRPTKYKDGELGIYKGFEPGDVVIFKQSQLYRRAERWIQGNEEWLTCLN